MAGCKRNSTITLSTTLRLYDRNKQYGSALTHSPMQYALCFMLDALRLYASRLVWLYASTLYEAMALRLYACTLYKAMALRLYASTPLRLYTLRFTFTHFSVMNSTLYAHTYLYNELQGYMALHSFIRT